MLFRKPKRFNAPCRLIGSPLEIKVPQYLWDQFAHFHDGDVLPNACPRAVTELDQDLVSIRKQKHDGAWASKDMKLTVMR